MIYYYCLICILISATCSSSYLEELLKEFNISSAIIIHPNNTKEFSSSVKVANQRCQSFCPDIVIRPRTALDASAVVKLVRHNLNTNNELINLAVRGGGHSYTCQSVKLGGILLDMRGFTQIDIRGDIIKVGAGLTFKDIFKVLNTKERSIIHGQCLNVGVVGYTLHGGVHFGGLSNQYGLGSDNMVGVEMIISNGSVVDLHTNADNTVECTIDEVMGDSHGCSELMQGMKGAGSSFGVVTSIDVKLVRTSHIKTALTILSIDISDVVAAERAFQSYLANFLPEMSVTFFGLDSFFKAYFFVLKFAKHRSAAWTQNKFTNNFRRYEHTMIHFVIEVSWLDNNEFPSDELHPFLQTLHKNYQQEKLELRTFFITSGPWAVDSYDLVWGSGHYYTGASITVDEQYSGVVLQTLFDSFLKLKSDKYCSDCVVVIHRVGNGLKRAFDANSSYNPFIQSSHLWVEVDCGHFFRRQMLKNDWLQCTNFVDNLQMSLDKCTREGSRMHYPNVPSLVTENWPVQYYGVKTYRRLETLKSLWDSNNIFNHVQSIWPSPNATESDKEQHSGKCVEIYNNHGLKDLKNILRAVLGMSAVSYVITRVKAILFKDVLFPQRQRLGLQWF